MVHAGDDPALGKRFVPIMIGAPDMAFRA